MRGPGDDGDGMGDRARVLDVGGVGERRGRKGGVETVGNVEAKTGGTEKSVVFLGFAFALGRRDED